MKPTLDLFKGLLFLHGHFATPEFLDDTPHFGAATAADDFAPPLGNAAASQRWFGPRGRAPTAAGAEEDCVAG